MSWEHSFDLLFGSYCLSIIFLTLNACSNAERVNFSLVADLKDPLIAKASYSKHLYCSYSFVLKEKCKHRLHWLNN